MTDISCFFLIFAIKINIPLKHYNSTYASFIILRLLTTIVMVFCIPANIIAKAQEDIVDSLLRRGIELSAKTSYAAALECNLQALDIVKHTGQKSKLPVVYLHIGNIFSHINDLSTAKTYYLRALPMTDPKALDDTHIWLLNNLFYVSYLQNEPDSAANYLYRMERLNPKTPRSRYDLIFNRGLLLHLTDKQDSALIYYHKAARMSEKYLTSRLNTAAANSAIADLYLDMGRTDSAMKYYKLNERIARDDDYPDLLVESLKSIAEVYDRLGNTEQALNCKSEYLALSDSILSRDEISKIKNTQSTYELEGSAHTIRSLHVTNALQRNWILALTIFILIALAFSVTIWIQKKKLSRAYADLYQHNSDELANEIKYRERISQLEQKLVSITETKTIPITEPERKLLQNKQQRAEIMNRILHEFENSENYCRSDYSIEMLAAAIGSNARYVSEAINEERGMNFRTMLNEYRIKRSMQMLDDYEHYGNLTIKAISENVGYKSQSTFITVFVKQTGLKPSLYQNLSRTRNNLKSDK